jgi:hypothetical protein
VIDYILTMSSYLRYGNLSRLSARLEELFSNASSASTPGLLSQELADEIAATAGEVMVELAAHRGDELAGCVIEDARRLREVARTLRPEAVRVAKAGRTLASDLELIIRDDRRAA